MKGEIELVPTLLNTELWIKFSNIKEIDSQLNREINNSAAGNTVTAVEKRYLIFYRTAVLTKISPWPCKKNFGRPTSIAVLHAILPKKIPKKGNSQTRQFR